MLNLCEDPPPPRPAPRKSSFILKKEDDIRSTSSTQSRGSNITIHQADYDHHYNQCDSIPPPTVHTVHVIDRVNEAKGEEASGVSH